MKEYIRYKESMINQGMEPVTFSEWQEFDKQDEALKKVWAHIHD